MEKIENLFSLKDGRRREEEVEGFGKVKRRGRVVWNVENAATAILKAFISSLFLTDK